MRVVRRLNSHLANPGELFLALLLLAIVGVSSFVSWQQYVLYANRTHDSNLALTSLNEVVSAVQLAETSQRGYQLTSDRAYLDQYGAAVSQARAAAKQLNSSGPEIRNERLLSAFQMAVNTRLGELDAAHRVVPLPEGSYGGHVISPDAGFQSMQQIRTMSRQYRTQLQAALKGFREDSRFYARLAQLVSTIGCTGIFLIVYVANRRIRKLLATTANLNAELRRANADLQHFVYSASHDLQEPLRTVALYSQMVEKKARGIAPLESDLGHLRAAAKLMLRIVEDLLTYTQAVSTEVHRSENADLSAVFQAVCDGLFASLQEANADISHEALPIIPLSEVHARVLLQNLISNAIKYRKPGEPARIRVECLLEANMWVLSVADNGIGIEPRYHDHVFGIFKRLHGQSEYSGTGLGLAICKKIVERYNGSISVESELGSGSMFKIRIPDVPRGRGASGL